MTLSFPGCNVCETVPATYEITYARFDPANNEDRHFRADFCWACAAAIVVKLKPLTDPAIRSFSRSIMSNTPNPPPHSVKTSTARFQYANQFD